MSKNKDDLDSDLDSLGLDEFDEPPVSKDKSRNPILNTARLVKKSALNAVWGRGKRAKTILDGMPDVATSAYEGYGKSADVVSTLLSHTKDEVAKTEKLIKTQTRQLMPTLRKYLPDSMTRRIGNWSKGDGDFYGAYDPVQAGIDRMNDEIFNRQPTRQDNADSHEDRVERQRRQKEAANERAEEKVREAINGMRFDELVRVNTSMARDVRSFSDLASGPMLQAQKRSLEIQYRSLFALQDLIKIQQTSLDRQVPALDSIVKNTALPDYAKENFGEIHSAQFKRKVSSWINPAQYAEKFLDNIRDRGSKKISEVGGEIRSVLGMLLEGAQEDDFDLEDGSGLTPDGQKMNLRKKATELGSGYLAKKLLGPWIEKLQKSTKERISQNPKAMGGLNKFAYNVNNLSSISNSAIAGERDDALGGFFNVLRNLGLVDPYQRERVGLETRDGETLTRASKFDNKTWITINEIVPAWFGRLNRSILSLVGKDVNEVYDVTTRGFVENKVIANRVRKAVANDRQRGRLQETVNETVDFLDKDRSLNKLERVRLGSFIEQRASLGREFNVEQLLKERHVLEQAMGMNGAEKVSGLLRKHANADAGGTYRLSNEMARRLGDIQVHIRSRQDTIDEATKIYGEKALRDAGIFHYNDKDDSFEADRDIADPYTLFNSLEVGKTRVGRARDRQQEIARKLANGSASSKYLSQKFNLDGSQIETIAQDSAIPPADGFFGKWRKGNGSRPVKVQGMSEDSLRKVLYGAQKTNMVELLQPLREMTQVANPTGTRSLEEAIRSNSPHELLSNILEHVKSIDEKGIRFASGGEVEETVDTADGKKKKKKRGITATSLFGQWFQLMGNTASGAWDLAGKGLGRLNQGRKNASSWLRGKFGSNGEGPGLMSRLFSGAGTAIGGGWDAAKAFATRSFGNKDAKAGAGKFRELLHTIGGWGGDLVNGTVGKMNTARKWTSGQIGEKTGMVKDWMTTYPDIFVKGEKNARIKGRLLKAGNYTVGGKVIYNPNEITGAVFDTNGTEIVGAEEITNPEFKLVDSWGRDVHTPLGRIFSRIGKAGRFVAGLPARALETGKKAFERIAGYAKDNPLTRWWNGSGDKKGGGWFNNWFSGHGNSKSQSTDHILIRIYKLLNARMSGEAEDEAWTKEFERDAQGGAASAAMRKRTRRLARLAKRKMGDRWSKARERGQGWFNKGRDKLNVGWGWLRRKGSVVHRNANEMADPLRGAAVDIGTRYEALKSLYGRDDDVADFYRSKINRKGGFSKAKVFTAAEDTVVEGADKAKGAAKSAWSVLSEKMGKLVNLQEMSWFNTMRSSSEEAGANDGFIRSMFAKWSKRNPLRGDSEKKDYFQFFRRRNKKTEEKGTKKGFLGAMGAGFSKAGDVVKNLLGAMGTVGSIIAAIASPLMKVIAFAGKWGILKPAGLLARGAMAVGGGVLGTAAGMAATAGTALVTAVGWPVILGVGAVAGLMYTGYKMSQRKPTMFLDKLRLAHYGFRDYDLWSSDDGAKALYLEDNLKGYVTFDEADNAVMRSLSAQDVGELTKGFGIDPENKTETMAFHAFMIQRFIPTYLRWQTAVRQVMANVSLVEVGRADKVTREEMLTIFGKVKLNKESTILQAIQDPRKADQGLFSRMWDTVTFTEPDLLSPDEVIAVQDEVEKEIKARKDDRGRSKNSAWVKKNPATYQSTQSGVAESMNMLAGIDKDRYDKEIPDGETRAIESITIQVDVDASPAKKDLDALQSVRMKAYGLTKLAPAQVQLLLAMERRVLPKLNLKTYSFNGNWAEEMETLVPGCTKTENSKARALRWFEGRFLPVLLTYVLGVKRYVPVADPLALGMTGGYLYEVALLVSRAYSYRNDFRTAVWEVAVNPFGEAANDDPRSIEPELETLKVLSKENDMAVRNMLKENKGKDKTKRARWRDVEITNKAEAFDKQYANTNDYSNAAANNERMRQQLSILQGSDPSDGASPAITAAGGFRNYVNASLGQATVELGEGGEGDYRTLLKKYPIDKLNDPKVVQQLVADAARIVGVPEGVALSMAHAESKFDYRARPRNRDGSLASTAAGIFQFLNSTWKGGDGAKGELQLHGNKFGVPANSTQMDPYANALLGVNFIRNNIKQAEKDYGGKVPQGVAYLYHFMGAGNAGRFMKALKANPNQLATAIPFQNAAGVFSANKSVFFENGRPRTLAEVMNELSRRMGGSFGALATTPGMTNNQNLFKGVNGSEPIDLGTVPKAVSQPSANALKPAANDSSAAANDNLAPPASIAAPGASPASAEAPGPMDKPSAPLPNTPVYTKRIPDPEDAVPIVNGKAKPVSGISDLLTVNQNQADTLVDILSLLRKIEARGGGQASPHVPAATQSQGRAPQQSFTQPTSVLKVSRG
jgi:hypothetical protein